MFLLCLPPPRPPYKGCGLRRPSSVDSSIWWLRRWQADQKHMDVSANVFWICILMHISPIFLWNPHHPNHPIPIYKPGQDVSSCNTTGVSSFAPAASTVSHELLYARAQPSEESPRTLRPRKIKLHATRLPESSCHVH